MRGDGERRCRARAATVWPTGQLAIACQDGAGDGPRGGTASMTISPAVAARAIALYSRPGDTVCDPDCADGAVVVEAVRARRHAVGIATDPRAWQTARHALTVAKARGAPGDGTILDRPPDGWSWAGLGPVDLLLTAIGPPAAPASPHSLTGDWLAARLVGYRDLSRPAGRLVVVAAYHIAGGLDLASRIIAAGRAAGWQPVQRAVALTAIPYRRALDTAPATGRAWPAHHDVLLFRSGGPPTRPPRPPELPPSSPAPAADPPAATANRAA